MLGIWKGEGNTALSSMMISLLLYDPRRLSLEYRPLKCQRMIGFGSSNENLLSAKQGAGVCSDACAQQDRPLFPMVDPIHMVMSCMDLWKRQWANARGSGGPDHTSSHLHGAQKTASRASTGCVVYVFVTGGRYHSSVRS